MQAYDAATANFEHIPDDRSNTLLHGGFLPVAFDDSDRTLALFSAMTQPKAIDIDRVAQLARIALSPEEKRTFSQQLGDVLHHIEQLEKVDVTGVEPTAHAFPLYNVWQEDVAEPGLPVDSALRNAPAKRDNMIAVPKVVE